MRDAEVCGAACELRLLLGAEHEFCGLHGPTRWRARRRERSAKRDARERGARLLRVADTARRFRYGSRAASVRASGSGH